MKTLVSFPVAVCSLLAIFLVGCSSYSNQWGYVNSYNILLHRQNVVVRPSWFRVVTQNVVYPAPGYMSRRTITAILATDRARKNGGYAKLLRGGPGHRNATIHLKSLRGEGLNFTVEIWGY